MSFLGFTPQETKALIFLLLALLIGSGITLYQRSQMQFAPELIIEKNERQTEEVPIAENHLNPPAARAKINVNQASASELERVPGLGPKLSRRIVEYREANGTFQKLEDLVKVQGIGPISLEKIRDYLAVE
jgi:competence protein ComEA